MIMNLHNMIADDLEPHSQRNHAIPAINQIFCALRYYAMESYQSVVGDSFGVHRSTVSRIIARVTSAICRYRNNYTQFPATQNEITAMKQEFYDIAQFPNVIGAIDGTLVFIRAPVEDEHLYVSHKGGHSINILGVCDAKFWFTYAVSKYPGSTHDAYME